MLPFLQCVEYAWHDSNYPITPPVSGNATQATRSSLALTIPASQNTSLSMPASTLHTASPSLSTFLLDVTPFHPWSLPDELHGTSPSDAQLRSELDLPPSLPLHPTPPQSSPFHLLELWGPRIFHFSSTREPISPSVRHHDTFPARPTPAYPHANALRQHHRTSLAHQGGTCSTDPVASFMNVSYASHHSSTRRSDSTGHGQLLDYSRVARYMHSVWYVRPSRLGSRGRRFTLEGGNFCDLLGRWGLSKGAYLICN